MRVALSSIQLDTSIQLRANMNMDAVGDYADSMRNGATLPAVELVGTTSQAWIVDGWHRVMAAIQAGAVDIEADLRPGTQTDALHAAFGRNASNGLRRTNADKRREVELCVREFPHLSSRAIAEMCGVSHTFVDQVKPVQVATVATSVTGADGKQYPARRTAAPKPERPIDTFRPIAPNRDPLHVGPSASDVPDVDESELVSSHLAELKRHWNAASRVDREMFTAWLQRRRRS